MTEPVPARPRPRILVVDDQRDVAHTLSKLLTPLKPEVRFADDGEVGLQKLRDEVFDLALIDLAMPPDGTGGLWLLRELADRRIHTPTVILSGQGGQDDTIEAQRLGARDYVIKHKAADELLDVVSGVLIETHDAQWHTATTTLPTPVALPLIQTRLQADPIHRLHHSINCVESIFRFTALAAAASNRDLLAEFFRRPPAMGTWQALCRQLQYDATAVPSSWLAAVVDRSVTDLITVRNDAAHGGLPTPAWAQEKQLIFDQWLALFLLTATTRPAPRTVVAGSLAHADAGFDVDIADLTGPGTMVRWDTLLTEEPLKKGRVYLVGQNEKPIDLWPLITAAPADQHGQWTVFVLDSVAKNGQLRHINLATGRRVTSDGTVEDLVA
jgi:DNA-binding response OmpR family regulator